MQNCQILEGRFPNQKQTLANRVASEHRVLTDECERLAVDYCPHGAAKMLIAAFTAGTIGMTILPDARTAELLHGLARRFE